MTGVVSYHAGRVAEDRVADHYAARDHRIVRRRWRGRAGEIDLIALGPEGTVFIEVKSSHSHDAAAARLSRRQIMRLTRAAEEYLEGEPAGLLTPARFDVALVDRVGRIEILENALH